MDMIPDNDPIEAYLDQLAGILNGPGHEIRRALAESEDHLRESEQNFLLEGSTREEAPHLAIERFGTADEVARRYDLMRMAASPGQLILQSVLALTRVGAFVLISIGISGIFAAVAASAFGPDFIAGDSPGVVYSPERCADFFEFHPDAATCADAAVAHHLDETIGYRISAGILGLVVLFGWWLLRRLTRESIGPRTIPSVFEPIAATSLFAAATILLGGFGLMQLASSGSQTGAGSLITAAIVSLLALIIFSSWMFRDLRQAQ
jgi:hypothetical protein